MPEHQLINGSVLDRSGSLIGTVTRVNPLAGGDFSLVVQPINEGQAGAEVTIDNSQIKGIDAERKTVTVNADRQQLISNVGKTIQLVEERLVVNRRRVKVGEISVRRVVETEIVEVPIRREKLVVERIGEGEPLVELKLGEPRLLGNAIASGSGSNPSPDAGIESHTHDLTAIGNLSTIRDAVNFLEAAQTLDDHCEKIRVYIFLKQQTGLKATVHQFESSETAIQVLLGLEMALLKRCSNVRLELFLNDDSMMQTYQNRFAQYTAPTAL
ncbi:YsnF/AvaK domain-containing protein [Nodosilinea sp. LEGE 06152]|uniref:YsnF/AvaK domain-containing protein n=1 Tax=Nodosilinea sp. LEGE 06152 TaxID=2777966 RepID=UPI00187FCB25|nr:YsnF/AvaK domain-containing protein [Nodosilinea sp. LEGE 06152]MBE9157974.1 YsnF/AvaK domain-containing protein [Nodosilinea sp. LEGE 06152]